MASENVGTLARHRPSTISSRSMPRAIRRVAAPTKRSRSPSRRVSRLGVHDGSGRPGAGPARCSGAARCRGGAGIAAAAPGGASCCRGRARSCGRAARGCRPSWEVGCSVTRGIPSVRAGCMRQSPRGAILCPGNSAENNGCHRMPSQKGPKPHGRRAGRHEVSRRRGRHEVFRRLGSGRRTRLHPLVVVRATARPAGSVARAAPRDECGDLWSVPVSGARRL